MRMVIFGGNNLNKICNEAKTLFKANVMNIKTCPSIHSNSQFAMRTELMDLLPATHEMLPATQMRSTRYATRYPVWVTPS